MSSWSFGSKTDGATAQRLRDLSHFIYCPKSHCWLDHSGARRHCSRRRRPKARSQSYGHFQNRTETPMRIREFR
jgi:hypothetical protein